VNGKILLMVMCGVMAFASPTMAKKLKNDFAGNTCDDWMKTYHFSRGIQQFELPKCFENPANYEPSKAVLAAQGRAINACKADAEKFCLSELDDERLRFKCMHEHENEFSKPCADARAAYRGAAAANP
jgi:hypothetical protein